MESINGKNTLGLFLLGLTLAFGIIFGAYFISAALKKIKLNNGTITVKGYAEKKITSDFAKWECELSIPQSELKEAYEKLVKDRQRLIDFLVGQGIKHEDIKFSPVNMQALYKINNEGYTLHEIEGYKLSQNLSVTSNDVQKIGKIATDVTQLLQEGIHLYSAYPQYHYLKLDELKIAMLGEAAKDAKNRATQLAFNSGSKVGELRSAQQGVFQITPAYSNTCSDYGECDISSVEKTIKAIVTMEYGIE